jgi:peroxiredoxin Q/BCP
MPISTAKKSAKKAVTKKSTTKQTKKPAIKAAAKTPAAKKATPSTSAMAKAGAASAVGLVAVGTKAPDFTLPDAAGKLVTLSAFKGKPVVLYFYPKDDTPGCTQEACDFRDNLAAFRKLGCTVLGVSPDSVKSHAKFAAKHKLTITLLADEPAADGTPPVCAQYGIWQEKSMYGRAYMGVVRTTYVIAKDGTVAQRFDKVSVTAHVDEVLAAVKSLA